MMKKLTAVLLSLCILFSLSATAFAAEVDTTATADSSSATEQSTMPAADGGATTEPNTPAGVSESATADKPCETENSDVGSSSVNPSAPPISDSANFSVIQKARLVGDAAWCDDVDAEVGDLVEIQVQYKNTDPYGRVQMNVTMKAGLPSNLKYVSDSGTVYTSGCINGRPLSQDESIAGGVRIGNFARGANAYIRYTVEVVDDNLAYGTTGLVCWAQIDVDQTIVRDVTTINVTKNAVEPSDAPSAGFNEEPVVGGGYWNPTHHDGWAHGYDGNDTWLCDVNSFLANNPALREAAGTYFQGRGINVNIEVSEDRYAATLTGSNGYQITVYNWSCDSSLQPGGFELIPGRDNEGGVFLLTIYRAESSYTIPYGDRTLHFWGFRPQAEELCERLGLNGFAVCLETRGRLVSNVLARLVKNSNGGYTVVPCP